MSTALTNRLDTPVAYIVDDDDVDREVIAKSLKNNGVRVQTYATADSFLRMIAPEQLGCIVLDICMPGMSGQELLGRLRDKQIKLPIIFLSGMVNIAVATQAMRLGAIDVLEKPIPHERLFESVQQAFKQAITNKQADIQSKEVELALLELTQKERLVMKCLLDGMSMKAIAQVCDCSIATVARFQTKVLEKMSSVNTAQLVIKMHKVDKSLFDK